MTQLYKVLVNGSSCHGGSLQWSLPHDGQPGEWHEVTGELRKCYIGIHLTDDPARWYKPGCTIYPVEAEGVIGSCDDDEYRKAVCRRARLLREATAEELDALRIWSSGEHEIDKLPCVVSGSATVRASGSATVEAWDSATVRASDSATVEASGSATVEAWDSATVRASGSATVEAKTDVTVISWKCAGAIRIEERAIHIERGYNGEKPVIHTADEATT